MPAGVAAGESEQPVLQWSVGGNLNLGTEDSHRSPVVHLRQDLLPQQVDQRGRKVVVEPDELRY